MACSNNVVRAALTPKFRDVNLLVEMLTYNMGAPAVLPAESVDACRKRYTPPINDFEIQILQVCCMVVILQTPKPCIVHSPVASVAPDVQVPIDLPHVTRIHVTHLLHIYHVACCLERTQYPSNKTSGRYLCAATRMSEIKVSSFGCHQPPPPPTPIK